MPVLNNQQLPNGCIAALVGSGIAFVAVLAWNPAVLHSPPNLILSVGKTWLWGLAFLWICSAYLAAWLAMERGRSPVVWGLVGLVLGPLAIFAVRFDPRGLASSPGDSGGPGE